MKLPFFSLFFFFLLFLVQFRLSFSSDISLVPPFGVGSWSVGGDARFTSSYIRVAEDRQSKLGWLWNDMPNPYSSWEITYEIRIHGVSRVGADGLGFWYTAQSKISGSVLGNQENFKGLGILIDTYDNDNTGMHPFLAVLLNDGTKPFLHDHEKEGHHDGGAELGGCSVAIRNLQHTSKVKVSYNRNVLTVSTALDGSPDFKTCVETHDVELPPGWFFGFTAATGHLADNHDLYSVIIRNLGPPTIVRNPSQPQSLSTYEASSDIMKILSNIQHQVHGIQTQEKEFALNSQKNVNTRLDKLSSDLASLRGIVTELDLHVRDQFEKQSKTPAGAAEPQLNSRVVTDLSNQLTRQFEKFEKEQTRKIQDLRNLFASASDNGRAPPTDRGYGEWLLWLTFGSVVLFGGFMTITQIRRAQRRQKKYF